ncbi:reverse transcriptase domain-containing protein [Tanacetum coccineum]
MSSFRVKKGSFLGYIVIEGLRVDLGRIQEIIISPTPRSPNQIRSLFLQLTTISKFIPKLAELKHPLREARTRMETAKGHGWTNEAEEAFQRIKRKLGKLPTDGRNPDTYFLCKEAIEEGSGIGIILVSPKEKMYSYAIRLKFKASNYAMGCEALLAGLAASASQGMKDLHVFIDSLTLVAQVEGSHTPATEQERRYKKEIMDVVHQIVRI